MWKKIALGIALTSVALIGPAMADSSLVAKSGQPRVFVAFFNCTNHLLPASADGSALHGTVKAALTTGNFCRHPDEPVWLFTYTSTPGYKGSDKATIYLGSQIQTTPIDVQ